MAGCGTARKVSPQCRSIPLRSISLTGFALWSSIKEKILMCEHNGFFLLCCSALLIAHADIIPHLSPKVKPAIYIFPKMLYIYK